MAEHITGKVVLGQEVFRLGELIIRNVLEGFSAHNIYKTNVHCK